MVDNGFFICGSSRTVGDITAESKQKTIQKVTEEPTLSEVIEKECSTAKLDKSIVKAIISVESQWNEKAVGDYGNSFGLMQIQPKWHSERMRRLGVTDLLDGKQNVKVGIDILKELYEKYGNYELALTVYNAGHETSDRSYYLRVMEEVENVQG